jgi:hypothetical protein
MDLGPWDPASGNIITTQYVTSDPASPDDGIYVLGAADRGFGSDTDEFDQHVVAHEFQHYLESALSRGDSPGGPHSLSDLLDMRVSFSEGYADAFAAMVLNDPLYRDSFGTSQASSIQLDIESQPSQAPGWYSEVSVARIAWDLFDTVNDDDQITVGFGPMFEVTRTALRNDTPLGSLFSFTSALRTVVDPTTASAIDARLQDEVDNSEEPPSPTIDVPTEPYASNETHSGVDDASVVLPIYSPAELNGSPVRLCGDALVGGTQTYNKLGNRRFLRFNVPSDRTIQIRVECVKEDETCGGTRKPDPDFVLSRGRDVWIAETADEFVETLDPTVQAGSYVLEIYEFSHIDPGTTAPRGRTCMTVSITG